LKTKGFIWALFCLTLMLNGCSVKYSFTGASVPASAKTFSVQFFQNQAPLAGPTYSQTFTDALRDYISSQSHLSIVTNGDLDFAGSITGFSTAPVSVASSSPTQSSLTRLTINVEVTYTDKEDPKKGYTATFSRYADYPSSQTLSGSIEDNLVQQIDKQLVQDVFDKAFNNW
jgi:hypothetical protein